MKIIRVSSQPSTLCNQFPVGRSLLPYAQKSQGEAK